MIDRSRSARASNALELLAICAVFGILVLAVDPRGDFPLNDDWDFAKAAWAFAETGEFEFTGYTAVSVRLQVLWGALWTNLFGASYEVLRASSLFLALATLLVLDRLLARLGAGRAGRLLAVAAMMVHPIWFWSAFTFMTHVPAIFMSLLAVGAFADALRRDDLGMTAAGAAATVGSYFIRQTGVVNSIAALGMLLLFREKVSARWRLHAVIAAAPTAVFAILFVTTDWLGGSGGELRRHYKFLFEETFGAAGLAKMSVNYTLFNWMDAGLFFLPLSALALAALFRSRRAVRALLLPAASLFAARAAYLVGIGLPMPFYSRVLRSDVFAVNIFVNWGLGPLTLFDTWSAGMPSPFAIDRGWRALLTFAAAALGAAAVAWCLWVIRPREGAAPRMTHVVRFLALHLLIANCALALSYVYNDRYGLDAHWPLVILLALTVPIPAAGRSAAPVALLLLALFSASAVAEYLEWNRARWTAIAWLEARGVPAEDIDGGVEHRMQTRARVGEPPERRLAKPQAYRVTFNTLPRHREIHSVPYDRCFGLGEGRVRVLVNDERAR